MNKLEIAREIINKVDKEMAELFEERMRAAQMVAEYKKERGLPIYDEKREEQVIEKNSQYIANDEIRSYYNNFIRYTMKQSRKYQHFLMSGTTVAYAGIEGAFAHIAAKKIVPDGSFISYPDFLSAYEAVVKGDCDLCVLPIENSYAGEVGQVIDIAFSGNLHINGIYEQSIVQNLLGIDGANPSQIEKVISHPQALMQCADYIKKHGLETEEATNTAIAAKMVKELNNPKVAAIASDETAENYGLNILETNINTVNNNTTRFALFSRVMLTENANSNIILFTVKNESGSLSKAVNIISRYGYNMTTLRSRPIKGLMWEYYFFVEIEGDITCRNGQMMLNELGELCDKIKVLGSYNQAKGE